MSIRQRHLLRRAARSVLLAVCLAALAGAALAENLVTDGDFEATTKSWQLRKDSKGYDWYESRKDTEAGPKLLMLSTKKIGGNRTHKAMIKAHPDLNTYLTFRLTRPLETAFAASFDIYVKEILPDDNRSAFIFLGGVKDKKNGPNSTGSERFVFLGFENAPEPGKMNLFAREGSEPWANKTLVATGLDLKKWYTIRIVAEIPEAYYTVTVEGVTEPYDLEAFLTKGKTPTRITHISFASWNDGAGTFYVDNVQVTGD
jgi:hypothetical protein